MKIFGWNCSGIYNAATVQALKAQIKSSKPDFIFLYETKASKECMDQVMNFLNFSFNFVVDAKGLSRGICLMWKASSAVKLVDFNKDLIAVNISDIACAWNLVGFYGPHYVVKKRKTWENLVAFFRCPWLCLGDFNYTLNDDESNGCKKRRPSFNNFLQELMFNTSAIDLGFSSNQYNGPKENGGNAAIKKRLYRAICSISWRLTYLKASVSHLEAIQLDHAPILFVLNPTGPFAHRPFRFEVAWIRDPGCYDIINNAWNQDSSGIDFTRLYQKQEVMRRAFHTWNRKVFGHCQDRISMLLSKIKEIQTEEGSDHNEIMEASLQADLAEWTRSEVLWWQKSRELWLQYGERNTKFFHISIVIQRCRNSIDNIKNNNGDWISYANLIKKYFHDGFKKLFIE